MIQYILFYSYIGTNQNSRLTWNSTVLHASKEKITVLKLNTSLTINDGLDSLH